MPIEQVSLQPKISLRNVTTRFVQKGDVIDAVGPHIPDGVHFIPGHPLAGTEHSGPRSGFAELFEGRYTIVTPLPDSDPAAISREDVVRERLARQFGADVPVEIVWVGPYAYRNECVNHMRAGRVFFMGDAAKVVSPFGARGGNTGVADADNLAWKLAAVLRGEAGPALLESYNDERLEAARENVRVTNRTARFLRPADGIERTYRQAAIGLARTFPFARGLINTGRMAVANPYSGSGACTYAGGNAAGQSVQNVHFTWADGSEGTVNRLLDWARGDLLLLYTDGVTEAENEAAEQFGEARLLAAVTGAARGSALQTIGAVRDATRAFCGAHAQADDITLLALRFLGQP